MCSSTEPPWLKIALNFFSILNCFNSKRHTHSVKSHLASASLIILVISSSLTLMPSPQKKITETVKPRNGPGPHGLPRLGEY